MARGRNKSKTPERIVRLLEGAVKESSQSAVARNTGLPLYTVQRCLKGEGEPTTATLQKISDYFGVSVAWLRGEEQQEIVDLFENNFESYSKGLKEELPGISDEFIKLFFHKYMVPLLVRIQQEDVLFDDDDTTSSEKIHAIAEEMLKTQISDFRNAVKKKPGKP